MRRPRSRRAFVTLFSPGIDATVSLLGFLLQLFVTSRVIRVFGVRGSLFILPVLALVNYSIIAVVPILAVVRIGKILENSTDYSIQNTVRQALFLPTSPRGEVQGQGGDRHVLHAARRRVCGRRRVSCSAPLGVGASASPG